MSKYEVVQSSEKYSFLTFTAITRVRIPSGTPIESESSTFWLPLRNISEGQVQEEG